MILAKGVAYSLNIFQIPAQWNGAIDAMTDCGGDNGCSQAAGRRSLAGVRYSAYIARKIRRACHSQ